jgi:hypothetical protein
VPADPKALRLMRLLFRRKPPALLLLPMLKKLPEQALQVEALLTRWERALLGLELRLLPQAEVLGLRVSPQPVQQEQERSPRLGVQEMEER